MWKKVWQHIGLASVMLEVVIASHAGDLCSLLFGGASLLLWPGSCGWWG
jgi:hypothetical protein